MQEAYLFVLCHVQRGILLSKSLFVYFQHRACNWPSRVLTALRKSADDWLSSLKLPSHLQNKKHKNGNDESDASKTKSTTMTNSSWIAWAEQSDGTSMSISWIEGAPYLNFTLENAVQFPCPPFWAGQFLLCDFFSCSSQRKPTQYVKDFGTLSQAMRPLLPFIFLVGSYIALHLFSDALIVHPKLFCYSYGIAFSNICVSDCGYVLKLLTDTSSCFPMLIEAIMLIAIRLASKKGRRITHVALTLPGDRASLERKSRVVTSRPSQICHHEYDGFFLSSSFLPPAQSASLVQIMSAWYRCHHNASSKSIASWIDHLHNYCLG